MVTNPYATHECELKRSHELFQHWTSALTDKPNFHGSCPPPSWSDVQSVRLSRNSCIMSVESLYESSETLSSSAIASSKAVRAILQASSGFCSTSYWKTEKFRARPRRIGCVTARSFSAH